MRTRVKICGICTLEDALMVHGAGADYVGFVLTESPRRVPLDAFREIRARLPKSIRPVGVFANEPPEVALPIAREFDLPVVQVSGWLSIDPLPQLEVWHVLREPVLPDPSTLPMIPLRTYVLDSSDPERPGGTGRLADLAWAAHAVRCGLRLIVAGGLDANRVIPVIDEVRPFGVDASSRLESGIGRKDPQKVRAFVERVREIDRARAQRS